MVFPPNKTFQKEIKASLPGFHKSKRDAVFTLVAGILTALMLGLPTGFEGSAAPSERAKVKVVEVNNEKLKVIGPVRQGEQQLEVEIVSGRFKGQIHAASNNLIGKMELDKVFLPGDAAFAVLNLTADTPPAVAYVQVIDHYRTGKTLFLAAVFIVATFVIMGWMGLKIVISFVFSAAALIRVLYPMILRGWDPIAGSLVIVTFITALIMFLVGGVTRRALAGFLGAMGGVFFTALLASVFTGWFKIHGAVRPFTETLLFSGFGHLNLARLFIAGIFIAASGAMMDLAMDIAAAMDEIKAQSPSITRRALMRSGFTVARQAAGTMSTTLLLAYSAEYTAMIMVFIAQGVPLENVLTMVWVSSEVVHTLTGCFGLVLVAPLTVFAGGMILPRSLGQH